MKGKLMKLECRICKEIKDDKEMVVEIANISFGVNIDVTCIDCWNKNYEKQVKK